MNAYSIAPARQSRWLIMLSVVALFAALGLWRFHEALFTSGQSLTNLSDGIAAIGGIRTFGEEIERQGWTALLGDLHHSTLIGAGLQEPRPFNPFYKLIVWSLSYVAPPDNAWDVYGLISFILMGLAGYLLAREVSASSLAALAAALLLTHLDAFHARLPYHLFGLGSYYLPLFALWAAVRAGRRPTWGRLTAFAGLMTLNFLGNEYYGYFGAFAAAVTFAGYGLLNHPAWPKTGAAITSRLVGAATLFTLLMILAYPHQVGARLLNWLAPATAAELHQPVRTWPEFMHYATDHPLYIFRPASERLASHLPDALFQEAKDATWEFSYRVGLALPAFTGLLLLGAWILRRRRAAGSHPAAPLAQAGRERGSMLVWLAVALFIALFGVSPAYPLSLVPFTYALAPIFRVGARAFLYVDIALIMLFVLALTRMLRALETVLAEWRYRRLAVGAMALTVTGLTLADVSSQPLLAPLPTRVLPDIAVYAALRDRPPGPLLELPLFSLLTYPPEINSFYVYHRVAHRQPLLNFIPTNPVHAQRLDALAERLSYPDEAALRGLRDAGVRYLAARSVRGDRFVYRNGRFSPLHGMTTQPLESYAFAALDQSPLLIRLASDGAVTLYEFTAPESDPTSFAKAFILREPELLSAPLPHPLSPEAGAARQSVP